MPPKKKPKKKPRNTKGKSYKASVSQYSVDWLLLQHTLAHNISLQYCILIYNLLTNNLKEDINFKINLMSTNQYNI